MRMTVGVMKSSRLAEGLRVTAVAAALLVLAGIGPGRGVAHAQLSQSQTPPTQPGGLPPLDAPAGASPADPATRARMEQERMKAANDDRHKRLAADCDRLVALTNELKTDVDKTNRDELSLDVIKKAQEIEKLAHDVQNRMKN